MSRKQKTNAKSRAQVRPAKGKKKVFDLVIVGGGPVGLALVAALKNTNLSLCLIEKQGEGVLAKPSFDGRDTALTHSSLKLLKDLGIWPHLSSDQVSPIKEARVLNGTSPYFLNFDSRDEGEEALGYLVSNHLIRQAAYRTVKDQSDFTLRTGVEVTAIEAGEHQNLVTLSDGSSLSTSLVVAADSRFSPCRAMMGISASDKDFGRTVVVSRVKHTKPHNNIAHECFHYGRTLAVLPLNGQTSSIVITLPSDEAANLCSMSAAAFSADVTERFGSELGTMTLITERHAYPLRANFADRFNGARFALLGDSAVGMHPVTAHGFNFGLYGASTLANEVKRALRLGIDIGSANVLGRYNRAHRQKTLALYLGTNALVKLFTNETMPAKMLRKVMLRLGNAVMPAKAVITRQLTQKGIASDYRQQSF